MLVHELAEQAHVPPHVVRFYARCRLLPLASRAENGYRLYGEPALRRLRFIRNAQALRLTLAEIRRFFAEDNCDIHWRCPNLETLLQRRLMEIRAHIQKLSELQHRIEETLERWHDPQQCTCANSEVCSCVVKLVEHRDSDLASRSAGAHRQHPHLQPSKLRWRYL